MSYTLHFARGEAGDAVVAAYDNQGVVQLTDFFEAVDYDTQSCIDGETFAEIVVEVLANVVDVGEEGGHAAFEVIGFESPEVLAGTALPASMGVGGAPPVAEWCVIGAGVEEAVEVGPDLVEEFLLCVGDREGVQP